MAIDKRASTAEPLTEHDVAERLDRAALRVLRIMISAENLGIVTEVQASRYFTNAMSWLAAELQRWSIEPRIPSTPSPERQRLGQLVTVTPEERAMLALVIAQPDLNGRVTHSALRKALDAYMGADSD